MEGWAVGFYSGGKKGQSSKVKSSSLNFMACEKTTARQQKMEKKE